MQQYEFRRAGKKCSVTDRTLEPGEFYWSALMELPDGQMSRIDCAADTWEGQKDDCIGSWKQQIPDLDTGKVYWAPRSVLLAYFKHQIEKKNTDLVFVMSLLLVQKRILYLKNTIETDTERVSVLIDRRSSETFEVPDSEIDEERVQHIQNELAEHLFSNQPVFPEDETEA